MKKILAIVITVCVVFGAAAAFAQPRKVQSLENREFRGNSQLESKQRENFPPRRFNAPCFECRRGRNFVPDMPKEIREKAAELAKLRIDLEEAMTSEPINKAKALDTFEKIQKLEQEINSWRFAQKLERIEQFKKQREINKKIPPAPFRPRHEAPETKDAPKD